MPWFSWPRLRVLRRHRQRPVLDLLQDVGLAVRAVNVDEAGVLIDERLVPLGLEGLPDVHERRQRAGVRTALDVEVAGVEPATDGKPGNTLERLVLRVRRGAHPVAIEVLEVERRLQRVVHVRQAVPDSVRLVDHHVVHLHREPDVRGRVPDRVVHVRADRERLRFLRPVLDVIEPRAVHRAEVRRDVLVPEVRSPGLGLRLQPFDRSAVRRHLEERRRREGHIVLIEFDDRDFLLRRVIAGLRKANDRSPRPVRNDVRAHQPFRHLPRRLRLQQRSDDEPAVLGEIAPVEQLESARHGVDADAAFGILGSEDQRLPRGHGLGLDVLVPAPVVEGRVTLELADLRVAGLGHGRPGRVAREDPRLAVGQVRALEVPRRQELEVEPRPTLQFLGHRLVDVNGNTEAGALGCHHQPRVEIEGLVPQHARDRVRGLVDLPLDHLRNLVPLLGRGRQANGPAGGQPDAVQNDLDAGRLLVEEHAVVLVGEDEDIEPARLEVLAIVELQADLRRLGCLRLLRRLLGDGRDAGEQAHQRKDRRGAHDGGGSPFRDVMGGHRVLHSGRGTGPARAFYYGM